MLLYNNNSIFCEKIFIILNILLKESKIQCLCVLQEKKVTNNREKKKQTTATKDLARFFCYLQLQQQSNCIPMLRMLVLMSLVSVFSEAVISKLSTK